MPSCGRKTAPGTGAHAPGQLTWISHRLVPQASDRFLIYCLDGTDASKFEERVVQPALRIVEHLLDHPDEVSELPGMPLAAMAMLIRLAVHAGSAGSDECELGCIVPGRSP